MNQFIIGNFLVLNNVNGEANTLTIVDLQLGSKEKIVVSGKIDELVRVGERVFVVTAVDDEKYYEFSNPPSRIMELHLPNKRVWSLIDDADILALQKNLEKD